MFRSSKLPCIYWNSIGLWAPKLKVLLSLGAQLDFVWNNVCRHVRCCSTHRTAPGDDYRRLELCQTVLLLELSCLPSSSCCVWCPCRVSIHYQCPEVGTVLCPSPQIVDAFKLHLHFLALLLTLFNFLFYFKESWIKDLTLLNLLLNLHYVIRQLRNVSWSGQTNCY